MISRRPRPRRSRTKWLLLALAIVAAIYLSRTFRRARQPVYPVTAFHEVKRGDMLISVTEEGALRALNETVVRNNLEGLNRIIRLVPEGVHVKKGELIVELDSAGLKERLSEQELTYQERLFQLSQAQGNLKIQKSLAESQIKDAELRLENAQSDLEKYRDGDAPLLIRTVESRSAVLTEQVRIASERFARTQELFKTGSATRSELQADELSLKREQLGLVQYQEDLRLIKKFDQPNQLRLLQSKVQQAREDLDRLKQTSSNEIAQVEADLKTSERTISFLEESLGTQRKRLENARIYAPQDGLVVYAAVSPFQNFGGGNEGRREEGRFRGGRGPGGGDGGEFRGGGRRGRSGSDGGSGGGSSSSASTAQAVATANQRVASAISGAEAASSGSGGAGSSSSGARGGGGNAGGGSSSAGSSFASYPSMRPSSSIPAKSPSGTSSGSGGSVSGSSSASTSSGSQGFSSGGSQYGSRSQYSQNFAAFDATFGASGFLEEGIMVRQRQELIRLPDVSKMIAEIKIHESRIREVRQGMTAYVRIENIPHRRFKATVRRVAPLPDSQMSWMNPNLKVYPTDLLIEDQLPDLKPGVSARAEVIITNLAKVLSVPIQTVARLRGENVCFVKRGSGVVPVPVTTGWFNDKYVEVTAGLIEGDHVLLAPAGDEAIEAAPATETNQVESVAEQAPAPPPAEEVPAPERRMQRRNPDAAAEGDAPSERRRERGQGRARRPQPTQDAVE